jgi:hypothetical protein
VWDLILFKDGVMLQVESNFDKSPIKTSFHCSSWHELLIFIDRKRVHCEVIFDSVKFTGKIGWYRL